VDKRKAKAANTAAQQGMYVTVKGDYGQFVKELREIAKRADPLAPMSRKL
jgi:uncharacterized protein HemY